MQKHGGGYVNPSNLLNSNLDYFGTQRSFQTQSKSFSRSSVESYPISKQVGNLIISLFDSELIRQAYSNLPSCLVV